MKRKIITTADGSKTIQIEEWNEQYHSVHGAINEANHVYLKHGLLFFNSELNEKNISILEMGFGTGLNAFLTLIEAEKRNLSISYVGVEAYPVLQEEIEVLNYVELISAKHKVKFEELHRSSWHKDVKISDFFKLKKEHVLFKDINYTENFDVIYFDAFGPRVQPELWTEDIFKLMYEALKPNGVLVTYSVQGTVKRALRAVGFIVKRLEGPPNKRHMLRAIKR
ncbi:SAM-dependent methyltransferase [Winogradskyella sp. PC-19]|uniref:tRNA (5-methylaminomethyl-2-thiouridine)(34)-methyltransferase MnmD n=1 Tax=unclassified Winogradskyella TaxID=2615021 RepID=UPI000B3CFFCE|nr:MULTISPECIES: tRNA (5-methylaminomethyl-2-thiouridine)(34)-methyltransferase MnmD [unclassified Winogradskyella]ARV09043.1 SAM-dependent methyltransferase [Winogradskyella sp. PC-19]RZN77639.1 MAG: methyltransferase domain-containing protein [Winogradskyella sp.]